MMQANERRSHQSASLASHIGIQQAEIKGLKEALAIVQTLVSHIFEVQHQTLLLLP